MYSINPSSSVGYLYWNPKSSNTYETTAATQRKIWGCGPLMAKDTGPCAAPDVLISEKGVCEAYAKSMGLPFSTVDFNPTSYPPHPKCYWSGNRVYFYANSVVSSASSQCGPDSRSRPHYPRSRSSRGCPSWDECALRVCPMEQGRGREAGMQRERDIGISWVSA